MAKGYGPWVRHEWCPRCSKRTEQTRWHRRPPGAAADEAEHGIRCNECAAELNLAAS
jgi:DNA-directed RNA polymerase subunit RPC12/RpoP